MPGGVISAASGEGGGIWNERLAFDAALNETGSVGILGGWRVALYSYPDLSRAALSSSVSEGVSE